MNQIVMFQKLNKPIIGCLLLISSQASALSSDQCKPYYIESNSITYYQKKHMTIYLGQVKARQGSTHLTADKLIVYTDPKTNQVNKVFAYGKPARYNTLPDNKPRLYAEADTIKYYPIQNTVLLLKHGKITQSQNVFTGPHIWYDIKNQRLISTTNGHGKTTITIQPQTSK